GQPGCVRRCRAKCSRQYLGYLTGRRDRFWPAPQSLALPTGSPFLSEGQGAFPSVVRCEDFLEELLLPWPELRLRRGEAARQHGFGGGERQRRVGGDGLGQRQPILQGT